VVADNARSPFDSLSRALEVRSGQALDFARDDRLYAIAGSWERICIDSFQLGVEEPPGFAKALEARSFFAAVGIEPEIFARRKRFDRQHVPEIERDDVGDDAIDVGGGESNHFAFYVDVGVDGVSAMALIGGGADLHAPEAAPDVEDVVEAVAVSPRLGHAETQADGFLHEGQFGNLSTAFGRERLVLIGGGTSLKRSRLRLVHYLT